MTVFNGEIWNHQRLRSELEACGHRFRTRCDTEVLVHGWEQWGEALLERLEGMFAFALWDEQREPVAPCRATGPARSRCMSRRPAPGSRSARMRAPSCSSRGVTPEVDPDARRRTPLSALHDLPADAVPRRRAARAGASARLRRRRRRERRPYWTLDVDGEASPSLPRDLRDLLREAVRARLMSDVPIGILLSGGIDSTAVLGLAREAGADGIDTFTIGFADALYDERELARLAAERHGSRHHEVVVDSSSFLEALPRLSWFRDEPIAEPSEIPLLLLSRVRGPAREGGARRRRRRRAVRGLPEVPGRAAPAPSRTGAARRARAPGRARAAEAHAPAARPSRRDAVDRSRAAALGIVVPLVRTPTRSRRSSRRSCAATRDAGQACSSRSHASSRRTRASIPAAGC